MAENFGGRLTKLEAAVDDMTGAAAKLQEAIAPHMQREMQGVRNASPVHGRFPQGAVNEAARIAPGMELMTSAGRWDHLARTHQDLGNIAALGKSGAWRNSMEVLTHPRVDVPKLTELTRGSPNVQKLATTFNERIANVSSLWDEQKAASRAGFRTAVGAILVGEATNYLLENTVLDGKAPSAREFGTEMMLGIGVMAIPRVGFVGKVSGLVGSHLLTKILYRESETDTPEYSKK